MATRSDSNNKYDFSGIVIDELVAKPLVSVAIAQSKMAQEQVRLLLKNCFYYDNRDQCYRPRVIKMTLARGVLAAGHEPDEPPTVEEVVTHFTVPLITIFPFAALGVDTVNIDFALDVTAQYTTEPPTQEARSPNDPVGPASAATQPASGVQVLAKVAPHARGPSARIKADSDKASVGAMAAYTIAVSASPMSLTKGLLSLIEMYTNAIEPYEMPQGDKDNAGV